MVETAYDGLNRPEVISEGGRTTRYGYDLAGRAVVLVAGNGQTSSNTYDALGRLQDRTLFKTAAMSEAEVLAEFSWEHDALGNVKKQWETWPGAMERLPGIRTTTMFYDNNNRLTGEVVTQPEVSGATPTTSTVYAYDAANNRTSKNVSRTIAGEEPISDEDTGRWSYSYNADNQLTGWEKRSAAGQAVQKSAVISYDAAGNRSSQTVTESEAPTVGSQTHPAAAQAGTTSYSWDAQDRLLGVALPDGSEHSYEYDYRTRRIGTSRSGGILPPATTHHTAIVFSGGLSVAEWETENGAPGTGSPPTVEYTRGPDMGGGVGGLLYSLRAGSSGVTPKYNLSNGRGDIVAQSNQSAALTWTASYEAYGKRTKETGTNLDKQRGNSKDEDPTGLLNEGFRYRDLETGVWLSRDPAGFVDGPNLYAYCVQNPWTKFDPDGLYQTTPAALLHLNGIDTTSHEFQKGFQQGANKAAVVGAAMTVGVAVTVYTGGAAAPIIGKLGLGATGAFLTTAGVSGAAGGAASQMTSNALTGQPLLNNVPKAAGTGALFNMGGAVLGQTAQAFSLGMREGAALATAKELAKGAATSGATGGAANAMVAADGQIFTGLSKNAGGGPVSEAVKNLYGSARTTCAEARTLTAMEQAGVNPQGAVSAAASVGVKGLPAGTPMRACDQACAPVLKNSGIGDAVAGTSPTLAPVKTTVPVKPSAEDEKK